MDEEITDVQVKSFLFFFVTVTLMRRKCETRVKKCPKDDTIESFPSMLQRTLPSRSNLLLVRMETKDDARVENSSLDTILL